MFRNSYDNDSVTYSPTGRLFQVEYALEAIKLGSAAVGLTSKKHAVLVALKRNTEDLGSYQKKIVRVDNHMGLALAGLAPDARILSNYLRQQAISSKLVYDRPLPISRAVHSIADKAQSNTQEYGKRPYGVGLLIAGYDESGPHIYEFLPSGSVLEYVGTAIGSRSQAARTYLERNFEKFADSTEEQLVLHALNALRDTLAQDKELTSRNTSIAIVSKDTEFNVLDDDAVRPWLDKLEYVTRNPPSEKTETETETEAAVETEATETQVTEPEAAESQDQSMHEDTDEQPPVDSMDTE